MSRPTNALIVDDEPHVRAYVKLLLKQHGIETTWEAGDGVQALAMVAQHNPELVMLDINLPMMSGIEVLIELKRERPRLPVVMVTGQSLMRTVLECIELGAVGFIVKHSPKAEALKSLGDTLDAMGAAPQEQDPSSP